MTKEAKVKIEETDIRLIERKLRLGLISEKKLAEYLATMPDMSENAEEIAITMERKRQV